MSVLHDAEPGDAIYCIAEFHASPDGQPFSWGTGRRFRVGERLRFRGARRDAHFGDRPNGWHVLFETGDGCRYGATQTYFVSEAEWRAVGRFFARRVLREPRRRPTPGDPSFGGT